jgi:hypothetical protein
MLHNLTRTLLICTLTLATALVPVSAAEMTSQQATLFFAGLDAPASDAAHKAFQQRASQAWANYDKQAGQPMAAWSKREVAYWGRSTVFYPFSGPDFVTVAHIFPGAERYVLVAIQRARQPAQLENMSAVQLAAFEKKLGSAWEKFGKLGYFRTLDLDDDQRDRASGVGTSTILMAFAARLGYEVTAVTPLSFNTDKGEWEAASGEAKSGSVRLSLLQDGCRVTLDYVSLDLSDSALKATGPQMAWLKRMAAQPVLLKAASHLLQEPGFTILRDALVTFAPMVVQDETGLDYKDLSKIGPVRLYGRFSKTHPLFTTTTQPELAAAYRAEREPRDLPFAFSYLKTADSRSLQVVRRSPAK